MEKTGYEFSTFLSHPVPMARLFLQETQQFQGERQSLSVDFKRNCNLPLCEGTLDTLH